MHHNITGTTKYAKAPLAGIRSAHVLNLGLHRTRQGALNLLQVRATARKKMQ
jgi:hypothetical protein